MGRDSWAPGMVRDGALAGKLVNCLPNCSRRSMAGREQSTQVCTVQVVHVPRVVQEKLA